MRPEELPVDYVLRRREIVAAARAWIGTPYKHQGRGRKGLDCVGLLVEVANDMGHPVVAPTAYSSMPQGWQLTEPCDEQLWRPVRQNKLIPGDLAVFTGWSPNEPQHFAFIGDHPHGVTLIHSFSKFDKVVEQPWNRLWAQKFHGLYNLPGTEETYS